LIGPLKLGLGQEGNHFGPDLGRCKHTETAFQEWRSCLGLGTTPGWRRATLLRAALCLLRPYSLVALLYDRLPKQKRVGAVEWPG
jgi:hypothetical protein